MKLYNRNRTSYCFIEEEEEGGRGGEEEEEGDLAADPKTYHYSAVTASVSVLPSVPFLILTNANLETGFRKIRWMYFPLKENRSYFFRSSRTEVFRKINHLQQLVQKNYF